MQALKFQALQKKAQAIKKKSRLRSRRPQRIHANGALMTVNTEEIGGRQVLRLKNPPENVPSGLVQQPRRKRRKNWLRTETNANISVDVPEAVRKKPKEKYEELPKRILAAAAGIDEGATKSLHVTLAICAAFPKETPARICSALNAWAKKLNADDPERALCLEISSHIWRTVNGFRMCRFADSVQSAIVILESPA